MKKKKTNSEVKSGENQKSGTNTKSGAKPPFRKGDRYRRIAGLFLVLLSLTILFAFTSYLFTWKADASINPDEEAANLIGKAGRIMSQFIIEKGFGIASYVIVLLLFVFGIKLLLKTSILPLGKTTRISILALVWISVTCGFLFTHVDNLEHWAGMFGIQIDAWLELVLGKVGTGILLLFVLLAFLILNHNLSFDFLRNIGFFWAKDKQPQSLSGTPKEDLYNTVEYSLEDEDNETDFSKTAQNPLHNEPLIIVDPSIADDTVDENETEPEEDEQEDFTNHELIIEPVTGNGDYLSEPEKQELSKEHHTIDEPYDPWLELPGYRFPPLDLLENYGRDQIMVQKEELELNKNRIVETLNNYAIQIQKIKATIGPTVTLYEIIPAPGVRISRIKNLEDDIALSLSALGIRIIAPIPGKGTIGIEVPNQNPDIVSMKSILSSEKFQNNKYDLPFGIGKTISNESFVADLTKMPHILMAGATGQGKSVGLNAIITSLLYKKHPSELKFIMVDPKKVELTLYSKIERHFLAKLPDSEEAIITDTRKVVRTLNSLSIEMDNRYELLKDAQVRNIKEYNTKFKARKLNPLHGHRFLPYFVLVIDEFADLIMTAGKEIETPITRLAQLARAVGIHLIIATQRPSVNIITGSIKANFPARVAFRVISKIDSRTILDSSGADQLIGRGDMLLSTGSDLLRLQCAFVDTPEIDKITDFIGSQRAYPDAYHLPDFQDEESEGIGEFDPNERDDLFDEAARIIVQTQQGSTSLLQRKLKLGYNRAGRIIDQLEAAGIVGPFEGSKAREVKIANEMSLEQYLKDLAQK